MMNLKNKTFWLKSASPKSRTYVLEILMVSGKSHLEKILRFF